jgi:hypothetical protein
MIKTQPASQKATTLDDAPTTHCGSLSYRFGTCALGRLRPHPENPRTHDRAQRRKLKKLIEKLGLGAPPIIDENEIILAGHARVEVVKELGMTEIPVIQIFGLTEAKKRAYLIADNRAALDAGWDRIRLACEIRSKLIDLDDIEARRLVECQFLLREHDAQFGDYDVFVFQRYNGDTAVLCLTISVSDKCGASNYEYEDRCTGSCKIRRLRGQRKMCRYQEG